MRGRSRRRGNRLQLPRRCITLPRLLRQTPPVRAGRCARGCARRASKRRSTCTPRLTRPLRHWPLAARPWLCVRTSSHDAQEVDREAREGAARECVADAVRAGLARDREDLLDLAPRVAAAKHGRRRSGGRRTASTPFLPLPSWTAVTRYTNLGVMALISHPTWKFRQM